MRSTASRVDRRHEDRDQQRPRDRPEARASIASTSLYVAAGTVAAIGEAPSGFRADRVIDARGLVVCPGLIDLSARLREPGFEYKATLESEMQAAVAGGVTSLACPPDTDPPLDEPGLVEMLKHRARSLNQAHVYPIGALTVGLEGLELTEMGELAEAGCVAFSQAERAADRHAVCCCARCSTRRRSAIACGCAPQDAHLARGGVAHDGEVATRLGLPAIPAAAETIALASILALVRDTGVRVHLCRLSTAEGVAMVRAAKRGRAAGDLRRRRPSPAPVRRRHRLVRRAVPPRAAAARHARPRRAARRARRRHDRPRLLRPHAGRRRRQAGAVRRGGARAPPASSSCCRSRSSGRTEEHCAAGSARAHHVAAGGGARSDAGHLGVGAPADVCIFDPECYWRVEPAALRSQGKNTPFIGLEVRGKVRTTLVAGQIVHEA